MKTSFRTFGLLLATAMAAHPIRASSPVEAGAEQGAPAAVQPLKVTGAVADVVLMHQNGVSTEIILAYIQESGRTFFLTPSEIVELNRAGIPAQLMLAMIKQRGQPSTRSESRVEVSKVETAPAPPPPQVSTEPLYVTGSRRRETQYTPFIPPWVHGIGHYPYSYYRRYGAPTWRYSPYVAGHYRCPVDCRIHKHCRTDDSRHRTLW